MLYGASDEVLE